MSYKTLNQEKLIKILEEIFQLDQSDLDFGIYRIMNVKSEEIKDFLNNNLIDTVKDAFQNSNNTSLKIELEESIKQAKSLGVEPDTIPMVKELREKLETPATSLSLENEVFSHLSTFFSRYYKDGDFVSLRRYKKDTYAIPYEGEEVKLHWANSDQYYIKTSENFRDYTFQKEGKIIHFKLKDAQTESNNNKATSDKERRFVLFKESPYEIINDELFIYFEYKIIGKVTQDKLNTDSVEKVIEVLNDNEFLRLLIDLAPTEKNKKRTTFEKHLKDYTYKNSFDYFIHKDLGGFLTRELDFYIKNEILFLDDIENSDIKYAEVVTKIKAFKIVATKIISCLTQLENFQKKLWEKKKFVIETNYCITLDNIDKKYYQEIFENKYQLEEWKGLYGVEITAVEDLKIDSYLVVDTKFYDMDFKYRLLSEFANLEEEINGVLINSENFGALNLLTTKYTGKIDLIYIDPPYNAKSSEILYMNNYKHSSWLSFINNRVSISKPLLKKEFVYVTAIDEVENMRLGMMYENLFSDCENSVITIMHNPAGQQGNNFSYTHEFAHFTFPRGCKLIGLEDRNDPHRESTPDVRPLRNVSSGKNHLRESAANCFYPISIKDGKIVNFGKVCDENYHPPAINVINDDVIDIYPIDPSGIESKWVFAQNTVSAIYDELKAEFNTKKQHWDIIRTKSKFRYKSLWTDKRYSANSWGSVVLNNMFPTCPFTYPKSIYTVLDCIDAGLNNKNTGIILDYFAGSGTTGHVVINLNREDDGQRKYILVEMGEYFDKVTKPRIQKAVYSDSWKGGKPQTKNGVSQIFKYSKLESYEDSLNNLAFNRSESQENTLKSLKLKEEYLLNYSLDLESEESLLNIDSFKSPFNYTLNIATTSVGETRETKIDLVETFNYLLGLSVKRTEILNGFLIVEGKNLNNEKILIIWRDGQSNEELNQFFIKMNWSVYDREFDLIYVNGDSNLENLKRDEDSFKVKLIEEEFKKLMFVEL
jgi:adenine-specific DNA-methyltransferase